MELEDYEAILLKMRGYVSKIDKKSSIVLLISGGLDSMVTYGRLLEELELNIYPVHISRGQRNFICEKASIKYFENYFANIYGKKNINKTQIICMDVPPRKLKGDLLSYMKKKGHPLRDPILQMIAVQYAISLNEKYGEDIKTILNAGLADDPFPHCRLEAIRANNVSICENLGDWDWTITSANIDPYLTRKEYNKVSEIQWAIDHNFPVEKTFTCYQPVNGKHCGNCLACRRRKEAFKNAKIEDFTEYIQ